MSAPHSLPTITARDRVLFRDQERELENFSGYAEIYCKACNRFQFVRARICVTCQSYEVRLVKLYERREAKEVLRNEPHVY